jgi:hypothetical protein
MKSKTTLWVIVAAISGLLFAPYADGRGRGGGGGGGRGGHAGGRSAAAVSRSPSMSRSAGAGQRSYRQANSHVGSVNRSNVRAREATRPATQARQNRPYDRQAANNVLRSYATSHSAQRLDAGRAANITSGSVGNRAHNVELSSAARERLHAYRPDFDSDRYFNANFFQDRGFRSDYLRPGFRAWNAATWSGVNSWLRGNWSAPYYYYPSGYYYAVGDSAASDATYYGQPTQSSYGQTTTSYQAMPAQTSATAHIDTGDQWLPLGVFAVSNSMEQASSSNRFLQLAMDRDGMIEGAVYNALTDKLQNVTGIVDKNSQQVTLLLANDINSPIATTGLYNLTEDSTPLAVAFNDGTTQTWALLRLEE